MTPSLGTTTAPGEFLAPFVPSPEALVERMLEVARVGPGDTVYDLGAGDGRIVVAAAQRFGARAVGVELDNNRFAFASARIRDFGLEPRARMVHGDLLAIDFTPATVVTLYQFPSVNEMLRPAFERQLRPGARVVTLDFPIQGWKPSNVLMEQLTDGSQHAIYLYLINEIRKDAATMAIQTGTTYGPATCWLALQGSPTDLLQSAEGGGATASVKTLDYTAGFVLQKDIAPGVNYEDITISLRPGISSILSDWIDAMMTQGLDQPMNGAVVISDSKGNVASGLNFYNGKLNEIGFPALDAGSKDPAYITLKITPESTTPAADSDLKLARLVVQKPWLPVNFILNIDDLDCSHVNKVDGLTITWGSTPVGGGSVKILEIPNLALTLQEVGSEIIAGQGAAKPGTFRNWHENSVIKGDHSTKDGTLVYLDADHKTVLFTLKFRKLGIFKLTPEKYEQGDNAPTTLRAEMYCEGITFQGKSAGLLNVTVIGKPALPSPPPLPPSFRGTKLIPSYAPPFAAGATVNWKQATQPSVADPTVKFDKIAAVLGKEAPVADEVAAPLRLGRPLRFRS